MSTDVCVPVSHLPQIVMDTKQYIKESGMLGKVI